MSATVAIVQQPPWQTETHNCTTQSPLPAFVPMAEWESKAKSDIAMFVAATEWLQRGQMRRRNDRNTKVRRR